MKYNVGDRFVLKDKRLLTYDWLEFTITNINVDRFLAVVSSRELGTINVKSCLSYIDQWLDDYHHNPGIKVLLSVYE